ncbi:MAG: CHRD domain-containing protein [Chitinophagaceae bacterium]
MQKLTIFTQNLSTMHYSRFNIFFFLMLAFSVVIASCDKDDEGSDFVKTGLPMTPGQEVPTPPVASNATGSIDATYSQRTRTLSYKVTWQGLTSDSIRGMHIHGPADPGTAAGILQGFSGYPLKASGTYSGSVFVDGVVIKEEVLLANKLYINLHTKANPAGEIRGQLIMQ